MATELKKRSEVLVEDTWRVEDMYATAADWEKDLACFNECIDKIASFEGKVCSSAENLLEVLQLNEQADMKLDLAYNYAERLYDQDTGDAEHQAMAAKVMSIAAAAGSRTAFITPEIVAMDEATMDEYITKVPALELYRKQLEEIRRFKEHTLSPEMEKLIALTSEMSQTASNTFSLLNNADLAFDETTGEDGEKIRLTHGRFVPLLESSDVNVRKEAFTKYYASFKQYLHTFASLYDGHVKQLIFYAKASKYESTLIRSVYRNNVSPVVYKNLVDTVNKNLDKLHRYVSIRKKRLGVDELHMYDIYTPIVGNVARKYTFDEAKELCLKALAPLGEDYVKVVKEGFDSRWIDVYENQGKRSGAYSAGAYGVHPYVLMNFNGSLDNVFTLIHEMGHAMHSYLSNNAQPYIYSQYKIFVAEIASTCNEVLLLEYLLSSTTDKNERAYLLNHYLDMFKGTLFRQTQFAEYEMLTNEMAERGEGLNSSNLSQLYLDINKKYYGEDMISDEEISYEWARIPHFYYNFYVYQYATSFSAAIAIAHDILKGGAPVVAKYKDFLSSGCSDDPVSLVKKVDINMETPDFIQSALDVMGEVLDEMENI